jgi:hypothetical protein
MDESVLKSLSLNAAYAFAAEHGLQDKVDEIRRMEIEWDLSYTSTLRRGYIVDLFEREAIMPAFIERHWPSGATSWGQRRARFYLQIKARYEDFLAGRGGEPDDLTTDADELEQQFVAEADLRNVLAGNLECIEPGLRLFEANGRSGLEYAIDDGRIDILAVDIHGRFVVIELKLSRGRNRALGQILYYMAWVDSHLANPPCRGMIIAREIPSDLVLAATRASGVSLFRYRLAVSVERVASSSPALGGA